MEESIRRPNILDKDGKLSENVKGFIVDRRGELIGLVLSDFDRLIIEFLGKKSPMIVFDKRRDETEIVFEEFPIDPRRVLRKFIKVEMI